MFGFLKKAAEGLVSPIANIVGQAVTDKDERNRLVQQIKLEIIDKMSAEMEAKRDIIVAEAKSESWLTKSWRPISMLCFLVMLMSYWFGFAPDYLISNPEVVQQAFEMLRIGIGGYIVSRGGEKIADSYFKSKKGS